MSPPVEAYNAAVPAIGSPDVLFGLCGEEVTMRAGPYIFVIWWLTAACPLAAQNLDARIPPPPPPPGGMGVAAGSVPEGVFAGQAARENTAGLPNLSLRPEARAAASSMLPGYAIHQISHLRDGLLGNAHSWISAEDPSWAEIDLGGEYWICQVAFGSDALSRYRDRAATSFSILLAAEDATGSAAAWTAVVRRTDGPPVHGRTEFTFEPLRARWVRIAVRATNSGQARIDEIEIFGQKAPISPTLVEDLGGSSAESSQPSDVDSHLRSAFLGEEHAWLKTYGRADLSPRLVPYNGRVENYPRHVGDDRLPLPFLSVPPRLDGRLDEASWREASRGVARVAWPYDFERGPLVEAAVSAARHESHLYLAIELDTVLSAHLAVVSERDGAGASVLVWTGEGLELRTFEPGQPPRSLPVEGALDSEDGRTTCELRLPLRHFPHALRGGLRVGLGMGGKHTLRSGRPVEFIPSPLTLAEASPSRAGSFLVRVRWGGEDAIHIRGNATGLEEGAILEPGASLELATAGDGPIGPEFRLEIQVEGEDEEYALHLFRYDPLERTFTLLEDLISRLEAKGVDIAPERRRLTSWKERRDDLLGAARPDRGAERELFFEVREAKRSLYFRDPDLAPLARVLFVKRHAFEPSHNYSVLLDAPWRPGGGIHELRIPRRDDGLQPSSADVVELFDAGEGIARNPVADFHARHVYFGYRPSRGAYYHLHRIQVDGSERRQLTEGPFHDYWPCPLPDGGLAFISTRCKARYLCWRPQAAVMFRMDADGKNIRPLSFANLSEWAPSVMRDGRIIWTRSEYIDKGADFSHTLWTIRPDGTQPDLVFGNTIIQPNGYANGREVPGTDEICCTLISHFGDLNGPIALIDRSRGRFDPRAIRSITPEVPWPGMWPLEECFRDPVPVSSDHILCSHAPRRRFGLFVIDRFGNRELLHMDPVFGSMCPTPLLRERTPPVLRELAGAAVAETEDEAALGSKDADLSGEAEWGQFVVLDVYRGLEPAVARGSIKYIRVVQELRSDLAALSDGSYRKDHEPFLDYYATPVHKVSGPHGWPSYVAKATWGTASVEVDGSASFLAPAGKVLYLQALDEDFNEVQRMRSVVQLQSGERRSCIGCHEDRGTAPPSHRVLALNRPPSRLEPPPWGAGPVSYERVVQPVWNARCVSCHHGDDQQGIDLTGRLDADRVPASYRTLISQGWVHYLDCGWNSGGNEKAPPLSFGSVKSKLWKVLDGGHRDVVLSREETRRIKCWIDMNCPLWSDYVYRPDRAASSRAEEVSMRTGLR